MALMTTFAAAAFALTIVAAPRAETPATLILAQAQPFVTTQGIVDQNYMTTSKGCTYRRTQAPGHPPRWIIIKNPHHIGKKAARVRCKGML